MLGGSCLTDDSLWLQLTVNGVNTTTINEVEAATDCVAGCHNTIMVKLPPGEAAERLVAANVIEYLQGDWPVPTIYAKGSGMPGLPAAPFISTA